MRSAPEISRRVRILLALDSDEQGLTLTDVGASLDESGRDMARSRVVAIKGLRNDGLVEYRLPHGSRGKGGGVYLLTDAGRAAIEHLRGTAAAVTLATGAMQGEKGIARWSTAEAGQVAACKGNWVFGLGEVQA